MSGNTGLLNVMNKCNEKYVYQVNEICLQRRPVAVNKVHCRFPLAGDFKEIFPLIKKSFI